MIMDNRFLAARRRYDPDATRYINAVQLADGQALEPEVAMAVDAFVTGCKADSAGYAGDPTRTVWDAMKSACIMCGARTISGALVPLVGAAPTAYNFASANYNRSTGIVGVPASNTYVDTNRANNADGQDDNHNAVYCESAATVLSGYMCSVSGVNGANQLFPDVSLGTLNFRNRRALGTGSTLSGYASATGFLGHSRDSSAGYSIRVSGSDFSATLPSQEPDTNNLDVFRFGISGYYSDARLAFYSIGSALDLAALDTRVSTLVAAIAAAI